MSIFKDIENIYFLGAGGIGMSALVRYFIFGGFNVGGYDLTETRLTLSLSEEGCDIQYKDNLKYVADSFLNPSNTLIVYTPAIPSDSALFKHFTSGGFKIYKRAMILGEISKKSNTIAIAGTHGKTSISTLTAHLLKQSSVDCSAFLGGISKNYDTNLILGDSNITIIEADEYDRSFHHLEPYLALITSLDADHLDIYGNYDNMLEAFNYFASLIREDGSLVVHNSIRSKIKSLTHVSVYTYGLDDDSDFRIVNLRQEKGAFHFDLITPLGELNDFISLSPGKMMLENTLAAISLATLAGVSDYEIRKALIHFKGVKRRFDIRIDSREIVYIDDYAHHPKELDYFINSVKEFYAGRKITIVFQPHLYSRTRDHAEGFAASLALADNIILLPVYPAREEAIEGVSSDLILDKIQGKNKVVLEKDELIKYLSTIDLDIVLTVGAGDIDTMVAPVEEFIKTIKR